MAMRDPQLDAVLNDEARERVIAELFVSAGLLDKPRSMRAELLHERTRGFSRPLLEELAGELIETEKTLNAPLLAKYIRRIADDEKNISHVVNNNRTSGDTDASFVDPVDKSVANSHPRIVLMVDAGKKMRGSEGMLLSGVSAIIESATAVQGDISFVTLGKRGAELSDSQEIQEQLPNIFRKCGGNVTPLDAFHKLAKRELKSDANASQDVAKIFVLVADLSSDADLDSKKIAKLVSKMHKSGWQMVVAARAKKKTRLRLRQLGIGKKDAFSFKDETELEQALLQVANRLGELLG